MDRLASLELFTRIVELSSFSKAAESLNIPRATATYAIKELEQRLGTRLLERTTRTVRSTPDGQAFYDKCSNILLDLEEAEASLDQTKLNPKGTLRLDLHGTHATKIILPRINEFKTRYPDITLTISMGDRLVDLVREGIDCVVRAGTPKDSSLVAKRLTILEEVVCASPAYIDTFGVPQHPEELKNHQAVGFFSRGNGTNYPFEFLINNKVVELSLSSWLSVNNAESYIVAACQGCGLIQLPKFHAQAFLDSGALVQVLKAYPSPGIPVSVMYPYHRQLNPRVRVFIDWVSTLYKETFN